MTDDSQPTTEQSPFARFTSALSSGIPLRSSERSNEEEAYVSAHGYRPLLAKLTRFDIQLLCPLALGAFRRLPPLHRRRRRLLRRFLLDRLAHARHQAQEIRRAFGGYSLGARVL